MNYLNNKKFEIYIKSKVYLKKRKNLKNNLLKEY